MTAGSDLPEGREGLAHLNLADASRRLFELDPRARVASAEGWLFGAGGPSHPVMSNAVFRLDDDVDPERLLAEARSFFGELGRGFSLWARGGLPADDDLFEAAASAGMDQVYEMPEMILDGRAEEPAPSDSVELRRLTSAEQAAEYWEIAKQAYADLGFPPEIFAGNEDNELLWAPDTVAFLAHVDGRPVSIAMTIVSRGVAGIYWVGSLREARGMGLGRAVTAAATNAGLDLGAEFASLQASPMGRPIYEAMGYETIFEYRLLLSAAP